jgi:hypothetical protein
MRINDRSISRLRAHGVPSPNPSREAGGATGALWLRTTA